MIVSGRLSRNPEEGNHFTMNDFAMLLLKRRSLLSDNEFVLWTSGICSAIIDDIQNNLATKMSISGDYTFSRLTKLGYKDYLETIRIKRNEK